jgi:hypothetical protein
LNTVRYAIGRIAHSYKRASILAKRSGPHLVAPSRFAGPGAHPGRRSCQSVRAVTQALDRSWLNRCLRLAKDCENLNRNALVSSNSLPSASCYESCAILDKFPGRTRRRLPALHETLRSACHFPSCWPCLCQNRSNFESTQTGDDDKTWTSAWLRSIGRLCFQNVPLPSGAVSAAKCSVTARR